MLPGSFPAEQALVSAAPRKATLLQSLMQWVNAGKYQPLCIASTVKAHIYVLLATQRGTYLGGPRVHLKWAPGGFHFLAVFALRSALQAYIVSIYT